MVELPIRSCTLIQPVGPRISPGFLFKGGSQSPRAEVKQGPGDGSPVELGQRPWPSGSGRLPVLGLLGSSLGTKHGPAPIAAVF